MTAFKIEYDYDEAVPGKTWLYETRKGIKLIKTTNRPNAATVLKRFMSIRTPKSLRGLSWGLVYYLTNRDYAAALIFAPKNSSREMNMITVERIKSVK